VSQAESLRITYSAQYGPSVRERLGTKWSEERLFALVRAVDSTAVPELVDSIAADGGLVLVTRFCIPMSFTAGNAPKFSEWFLSKAASGAKAAAYLARRMLYVVLLLHSLGIVHGDLKPSNFVVEPTGELAVIDFGGSALRDPRPGSVSRVSLAVSLLIPSQEWTARWAASRCRVRASAP
jgi:serine/threonine protein kinase